MTFLGPLVNSLQRTCDNNTEHGPNLGILLMPVIWILSPGEAAKKFDKDRVQEISQRQSYLKSLVPMRTA